MNHQAELKSVCCGACSHAIQEPIAYTTPEVIAAFKSAGTKKVFTDECVNVPDAFCTVPLYTSPPETDALDARRYRTWIAIAQLAESDGMALLTDLLDPDIDPVNCTKQEIDAWMDRAAEKIATMRQEGGN